MSFTCKCNQCCENILNATSVTTGATFVFNTTSTITPKNGCKFILRIPCTLIPLTATTTIAQVFVRVNGINIPLQALCGNNVFTDQIRCFNIDKCGNIVLRLVYGSTPSHFKIVSQKLCCSNAYGTPVAVTSASESSAQKKTNEPQE